MGVVPRPETEKVSEVKVEKRILLPGRRSGDEGRRVRARRDRRGHGTSPERVACRGRRFVRHVGLAGRWSSGSVRTRVYDSDVTSDGIRWLRSFGDLDGRNRALLDDEKFDRDHADGVEAGGGLNDDGDVLDRDRYGGDSFVISGVALGLCGDRWPDRCDSSDQAQRDERSGQLDHVPSWGYGWKDRLHL